MEKQELEIKTAKLKHDDDKKENSDDFEQLDTVKMNAQNTTTKPRNARIKSEDKFINTDAMELDEDDAAVIDDPEDSDYDFNEDACDDDNDIESEQDEDEQIKDLDLMDNNQIPLTPKKMSKIRRKAIKQEPHQNQDQLTIKITNHNQAKVGHEKKLNLSSPNIDIPDIPSISNLDASNKLPFQLPLPLPSPATNSNTNSNLVSLPMINTDNIKEESTNHNQNQIRYQCQYPHPFLQV